MRLNGTEGQQDAGTAAGIAAAVLMPPKSTREESWATKVKRAIEARKAAQLLRKGKPAGFPTRRAAGR